MFEISIIILCLLCNALLAASETAFIALNKPTLKELMKQGNERAKLLFALRENPERTLSVIQVGITFVGAFAAAIGGAGAEETITPWLRLSCNLGETSAEIISLLLVVLPLTYISVVIGELVPKSLALRRPLSVASRSAPALHKISIVINPVVTLFEWSTKKIVSWFPKKHIDHEETLNDESSLQLNRISLANRQYVFNIVKIEETTLHEISVVWSEVVFVTKDQSLEELEHTIITSGHTRLPVIEGKAVIGIINAKEFLAFQKTEKRDWISILRPCLHIPSKTPILSALRLMQEARAHMAVVIHESQLYGIVTMESIFEEIVGDIYDEDDDDAFKRLVRFTVQRKET